MIPDPSRTDGEVVDVGDLVLDNVSPTVVSVTPAPGAASVSPATAITLTFNEPIQPGSLRAHPGNPNITLSRGGQAVPISLALANGDMQVVLTPGSPLLSSQHYTLTVKGAAGWSEGPCRAGDARPVHLEFHSRRYDAADADLEQPHIGRDADPARRRGAPGL